MQTFYLQDTSSGLAEVVEEYDVGGTLQASYDYAGSELIREDRSGATWYTHLDGLGSVRALSDTNGTIVATYTYDAFGNVVAGGGGAAAANPYRYAGAAFETSTGLYYLRARYYDPQAGRFLSHDPLLGSDSSPVSLHRYLYASVDPVNKVDPTGRDGELVGTLVSTSISNTLAGIKNEVDINVKQAFEDSFTHGVEYAQSQFFSNALFSLELTGTVSLTGTLSLRNVAEEQFQLACQLALEAEANPIIRGIPQVAQQAMGELTELRRIMMWSPANTEGAGTLAKLEVGGMEFFGRNGGVKFKKEVLDGVRADINIYTIDHAEGEVFARAKLAGVNGGTGRLIVDRKLCKPCNYRNGVRALAKALNLDSLEIYDIEGGVKILVKGVDY